MINPTSSLRDLDSLIADLDDKARVQESCAPEARRIPRRQSRHPYRVDCLVRLFSFGSDRPIVLRGRTRNLSRGGVGLILRRPLAHDEPVEVEVAGPDGGRLYMAGLVRFCRYVGLGYHEIGVALRMAGSCPVFPPTHSEACLTIDWFPPLQI